MTRKQLIEKYKFETHEDFKRSMDDLWEEEKKRIDEWSARQMEKIQQDIIIRRKELKEKYPKIFHMY
jgi:polyhydroxyalkanoate synthesis regulator phasin